MAFHPSKSGVASQLVAVILLLAVYTYPSFKARTQLGSTVLPPAFAPDLSLYLNLSNLTATDHSEVINPYYRVPVPANGTGYLKFDLAARLFGYLNKVLAHQPWFALLIWNVFWWGFLCGVALWVFGRFLPVASPMLVVFGLGLLMLFNFGALKALLLAWVQLPSLAAFSALALPFMRAFIPVIPSALVLAYLGLQMEALGQRRTTLWVAMAALQLLTLAIFPYATLMMAGVTAIGILWQVRLGTRETWQIPLLYGVFCALLDAAFVWHGSLGFYDNRSSTIHFQPRLLPHLVGGIWLLMVALTIATAFSKSLAPKVKWPLVGLGATNAFLMLGDAVVPATTILLSHHAAHLVQLTVATLTTFLAASALAAIPNRIWIARGVLGVLLAFILLSGALLSSGTYRGFLSLNREVVELAHSQNAWSSQEVDLIIAPSRNVDDPCGWVVLLSTTPVLFCTDAEVMLTPQQNREIHRFQQALYLYLSGENGAELRRRLASADPSSLMYRLGYWAEAVSLSAEEREQGIRAIQSELIPLLEQVESRDVAVSTFFRKFRRIIVIDRQQQRTFSAERLNSLLKFEGQQNVEGLVLLSYVAR